MAVNIAKLRDQARTYESRDQWREAIAAYRQILENPQGGDVDIGLWNRIGDLHLRQNEQDRAVEAYEAAVNAYVDVGLYNNAIALCRKILRLVPGRANVYRRLGQISAAKGFFADARQNFLEYADRMRRAGQIDAAFEALREFADLSPDDAEIRRILADQLVSHGHPEEAVEQLRILVGMLLGRGDREAAEAVREQIRSVDPAASTEPLARAEKLAVGDDFNAAFHSDLNEPAAPGERDPRAGLSMGADVAGASGTAAPPPLAVEGLEQNLDFSRGADIPIEPAPLEDALPLMDFDTAAEPAVFGEIDLEPTSLASDGAVDEDFGTVDLPLMDLTEGAEDEPLPPLETEGLEPTSMEPVDFEFGTVDLGVDHGEPVLDGTGFDLPEQGDDDGDLPMLDDEQTVDLPMLEAEGEQPDDLPLIDMEEEPPVLPGAEAGGPPPGRAELAGESYGPTLDLPTGQPGGGFEDPAEALRARVAADPADHAARDELVDVLHSQAEGAQALELLDRAHRELADMGRWRDAIIPLSQLIRLRPGEDGPLLQKRVEYAFRSGERTAMVEAYMALARHFEGQDNIEKARAVYGRVLEIEPPNPDARDAITALDARHPAAVAPATPAPTEYIDLGALILDDELEGVGSTRFIVEEHEPTGDEDRDFADMLAHFRQKVSENIEVEDASSHYDLGLAFKEMGLVDEAIAEFQVALRGGWDPLATLEMLGACFADKGQFAVATRVLERALRLPTGSDAEMVGVLYQLGRSYEFVGNNAQATEFYERVLSVDIRFRDTAERLEAMRSPPGAA